MIICPNCKTENEEDAKFCKNCGYYFLENNNTKNNKEKKKNKGKQKIKIKNKTKVKKIKQKYKEQKQTNSNEKSSVFTKILLLFFILLSICLLIIASILGYHYYEENNIEVPNVTGYTYEEAITILDEANLSYKTKEKETTDNSEVGIIIEQNKKAGSKTHENAIITLTIGVLDNHVTVPNVIGMNLKDAINSLNKNKISYKIEYKQDNQKDNNIVVKQSIKANKKIENTEILTITVIQNENNTNKDNDNNNETNDNKINNEITSDTNDNENNEEETN